MSDKRKTITEKAGLVFSVARCKRRLKEVAESKRIGKLAAIRLAATLETLVVEVLDGALMNTKRAGRKRLQPKDIKFAFENDDDLKKFTEHVEFMGGPELRMGSRVQEIRHLEQQLREKRNMKKKQKPPKPKPKKRKKRKRKRSVSLSSEPAEKSPKKKRSPSGSVGSILSRQSSPNSSPPEKSARRSVLESPKEKVEDEKQQELSEDEDKASEAAAGSNEEISEEEEENEDPAESSASDSDNDEVSNLVNESDDGTFDSD